jgi:hypothetical protein
VVAPPKPTAPPAAGKPATEHPRGTLLLVGLYGLVFGAVWFAIYVFVYLQRGGVTP